MDFYPITGKSALTNFFVLTESTAQTINHRNLLDVITTDGGKGFDKVDHDNNKSELWLLTESLSSNTILLNPIPF